MKPELGFWACWQCGGQHPMVLARCPNGSLVEGAPTRGEMAARWEAFALSYATSNPAWEDAIAKELAP